MRVLWLAPNGGNYKNHTVKGTGGWIGALQDELVKRVPDLELGIIFGSTDSIPVKEGDVSYFPIKIKENNKIKEILKSASSGEKNREKIFINHTKNVIDSFKPDLVHVWGVENTYAAVIPYLDCPFVVHIQGLLSLLLSNYMPPAVSLSEINKAESLCSPKTWAKRILHCTQKDAYQSAFYRAERELCVSKNIKNWMGRTDWDYKASQLLSPGSAYYHCDEIMRDGFSNATWKYHYDGQQLTIHSSISSEWYKGIDVILKTAALLKKLGINIKWNVFGVNSSDTKVRYFVSNLHINPLEVNVVFHGRVDGSAIKNSLERSDVFVHPSYIENSSNAIAEAMMLGMPTIAQYVGGNPSMLKNDSGVLVAANEPYMLAYEIMKMREKEFAEGYSKRALLLAKKRQNTESVLKDLVETYRTIISKSIQKNYSEFNRD